MLSWRTHYNGIGQTKAAQFTGGNIVNNQNIIVSDVRNKDDQCQSNTNNNQNYSVSLMVSVGLSSGPSEIWFKITCRKECVINLILYENEKKM